LKGVAGTIPNEQSLIVSLLEMELLKKVKKGRRNYYLNRGLLGLLAGE